MFQAGALIELSGDADTAFEIYYETYDIHALPPPPGTGRSPSARISFSAGRAGIPAAKRKSKFFVF